MRFQTFRAGALSAIIMCALVPRTDEAQVVAATPTPGTTRGSTLGFIGISNVSCNCTFLNDDDGNRSFTFRSNPVVLGVYEGSPADGALQRGDTITAIDGFALKTEEGGHRFANIRPGQRLMLNVSRGKSRMTLILKASNTGFGEARAFGSRAPVTAGTWSSDFPATPAIPAVPGMPAAPSVAPMHAPSRMWVGTAPRAEIAPAAPGVTYAPVTPVPPVAPVATVPEMAPVPAMAPLPPTPSGWFGFSIRCSDCGWAQSRGDGPPVWELSSAPELSMVASDGPAARAGLMAGDKITHVNGISILTPQGGRAFGRVRPGEKVRLTVLRNGTSLTRELTLATRPEVRAVIAARSAMPRPAAMRRELRYTGQLDNVSVEVWSAAGPSIERTGDTITITVGTSVIRLKAK